MPEQDEGEFNGWQQYDIDWFNSGGKEIVQNSVKLIKKQAKVFMSKRIPFDPIVTKIVFYIAVFLYLHFVCSFFIFCKQ